MAGSWNAYALGFREKVFACVESTYGTPVHPAATDAFQIIGGSFDYTQERVNRNDKTSSRSYRERMTHRKSVNWSVNAYLLPSGVTGTAPDITDLLEKGMGAKTTVADKTTHASTPCTTTSLVLTAGGGTGVNIGDAVGWVNAAGKLEVTYVTAKATDTLTVSPALSGIPATGATIKGSVNYKLANNLGSLTVTRVLDNMVDVLVGCVVNSLQFDFAGDGEGMLTIGGFGSTAYSSGTSALSAQLLATPASGSITFTVTTGEGVKFSANTKLMIDDEIFLVTGVAGDVVTATRAQDGSTAALHNVAAEVGPYEPTATVAGSPVSGTLGEFIITGAAGARTAVPTTTTQITIGNNASPRNSEYGKDAATGYTTTSRRDVAFSTTMWLTKSFYLFYNKAKAFTAQEVLIQLGNVIGKTVAAKLPNAEFTVPAVNGGGAEEVMVPINGVGLASSADNDEVILSFL